jgi:stalled ribosome rescue protein Dom34
MNASLVWLDGHTARVFEFSAGSVTKRVYHRHEVQPAPKNTLKADQSADVFFHQVADHLGEVDNFVLIGPGEAKHQFAHHLERHRHAALAKHLLTVESADHPTDDQLVALGRDYWTKHHIRV